MKHAWVWILVSVLCAQCTRTTHTVDKYTLAPLPEWTSAYSDPGDIRYFDFDMLMTDYGITRYQAAEIQNGCRDLT